MYSQQDRTPYFLPTSPGGRAGVPPYTSLETILCSSVPSSRDDPCITSQRNVAWSGKLEGVTGNAELLLHAHQPSGSCIATHSKRRGVGRGKQPAWYLRPADDGRVCGQVFDGGARVNRLVDAFSATLADRSTLRVVFVHTHDGSRRLALWSTDIVACEHDGIVLEQVHVTLKSIGDAEGTAGVGVDVSVCIP